MIQHPVEYFPSTPSLCHRDGATPNDPVTSQSDEGDGRYTAPMTLIA